MGIKSEPTWREGIFPNRLYHYVSILNRLIKTFRNTAPVEIGLTNSRKTTISTTILSVNLVGMERKRKIGIDDDYNDEQGDHFCPGSTRSSSPSWPSCGVSPLVSPFSSSEWLHVELMKLMRLMKYNSKKSKMHLTYHLLDIVLMRMRENEGYRQNSLSRP